MVKLEKLIVGSMVKGTEMDSILSRLADSLQTFLSLTSLSVI